MYSIEERKRVQDFLITKAKADQRISDAAIVGSESIGANDQWSDIDLSFGIKEGFSISKVIDDWTSILETECSAGQLLDVTYQNSIFRVFLLPNCLQIDLSFTPASKFGAITDNFLLLFGQQKETSKQQPPNPQDVYGYALLYTLKIKRAIERTRYWQAFHYLNTCRQYVQQLACLKHQITPFDAKGFDDLPLALLSNLQRTIPQSIEEEDLRMALDCIVECLITTSNDITNLRTLNNQLMKVSNEK